MTSRAHSNGCYTGDLWLGRLVAFHELLPLCCVHQLPGSQKSLHSSRNCSSRLLYDQWMMYLDRFSVLNLAFFCFSFVQNYNLRVGFRRLSLPLKVRNLENMCIRWIYLSDLPREFLWRLIWMRDICLIAFFFRSHFSPKLQVFLLSTGTRSEDRLLWTLKRSRDNPSPSFFSLHMNFSTSSLYSVVFVVAFVFFFRLFGLQSSTIYSEACKMQNLLQTGLSSSMPSIIDTWLVFNCCFWCEFL